MAEETTHHRALVDAYLLLDRAQRTARPIDIAAARAEARGCHWADVEFFLHYARYAQAELTGADMAGPLALMEQLADRAGDPALTAVVWACQAERSAAETASLEPVGDDTGLAAAVTLLDDGAGTVVHRPVAWIECALAYRTLGLWELEEEMLASAAEALDQPWPAGLETLQVTSRRCLWINRIEARASRVCEALESGERGLAAELARGYVVPSDAATTGCDDAWRDDADDVDDAWRDEVAAVQSVLDAAAGAPDRGFVAPHRTDWAWSGYPSCLDLARAIRAAAGDADTGPDPTAAADHAEAALAGMDQDYLPALRLLALALAGNRPPVSGPARRYARELVELRVAARHRLLDGARAQRAHERLRREHRALELRANVDQLTGVANRHVYAHHVDRLRARSLDDPGQVGVMVIDVDRFKAVNDRFGHGVGDEVLRRVAAVLTANVRGADLVARLGGDEFVVVFDIAATAAASAAPTGAAPVRARARHMVAAVLAVDWNDVAVGLTASISAGFAAGPGPLVDQVVSAADRALYQAKAAGRGCLVAV